MPPTAMGRTLAIPNTSRGLIVSSKLPEKYAEISPPTAAEPQHTDCNPPAIAGSPPFSAIASRVFWTTIPSMTTLAGERGAGAAW